MLTRLAFTGSVEQDSRNIEAKRSPQLKERWTATALSQTGNAQWEFCTVWAEPKIPLAFVEAHFNPATLHCPQKPASEKTTRGSWSLPFGFCFPSEKWKKVRARKLLEIGAVVSIFHAFNFYFLPLLPCSCSRAYAAAVCTEKMIALVSLPEWIAMIARVYR